MDSRDKEEFRKMYINIFHACTRDGIKVKYNKDDPILAAKIEKFKKEARKRELYLNNPKNYGVSFDVLWSEKYGFAFNISCFDMFAFAERTVEERNKSFDDLITATKKQAEMIRKARHHLACLIRLKNKLKLPGPIQKHISTVTGDKGGGDYLIKLSQEEIDEILKY